MQQIQSSKMKIKIVVEKADNSYIKVPITREEIYNLCELMYMLGKETYDTLKLNKVDIKSVYDKIEFLEHDVINEGRYYSWDKKKNCLVLAKDRTYLVKRPRWKKR